MPKYKNIKSVAHNLGHARASGERVVRIDFIGQTVDPAVLASDMVQEAAGHYARSLPRLLESQSVLPGMVTGAELTLHFDFGRSRAARYVAGREVPSVECVVRLTDDRGIVHEGRPAHWCYQ